MKKLGFLVLLCLVSSLAFGQQKIDFNIKYMLRGHIYAKSGIVDTSAIGGFAESSNAPKPITQDLNFTDKGLFLKIDTSQLIVFHNQYNGYKFYIYNTGNTIAALGASDGRLSVIAEVFYKGAWQPIEYLPRTLCGNSHHIVSLKSNQYWEFEIPKFSGKIPAKMRYKLTLSQEKTIYSNEVQISFNKEQLKTNDKYAD